MNFQNPTSNPSKLPVDVSLVKSVLVRLMTRNEADPAKRMLDRATITKNLESLNWAAEAHLGTTMQIMDKAIAAGRTPGFEAGLMFGVCLALAGRSVNGKMMLKQMLKDIEKQQDEQEKPLATDAVSEIAREIRSELPTSTAFPDPEVTQ